MHIFVLPDSSFFEGFCIILFVSQPGLLWKAEKFVWWMNDDLIHADCGMLDFLFFILFWFMIRNLVRSSLCFHHFFFGIFFCSLSLFQIINLSPFNSYSKTDSEQSFSWKVWLIRLFSNMQVRSQFFSFDLNLPSLIFYLKV